jgi:hypothetical protein
VEEREGYGQEVKVLSVVLRYALKGIRFKSHKRKRMEKRQIHMPFFPILAFMLTEVPE